MPANEEQRRERIVALIAEIAEVDRAAVKREDRLREDLGMDSLGSLELLSVVSEELELDLRMEDAMGISTVSDACTFIERSYASQHG